MKTTTLAAAFAHFGTYPDNARWSWSAVSPDKKKVAVTIWESQVAADGSVSEFGNPNLAAWESKPGNQERIRNLKIARDNCAGLFHVVWVTPHDVHAEKWTIGDRHAEDHFMMRLIALDESTGEFSAVLVDPSNASHERRSMADRPVQPPVDRKSALERATAKPAPRNYGTCSICHMQLLPTGSCGNCD